MFFSQHLKIMLTINFKEVANEPLDKTGLMLDLRYWFSKSGSITHRLSISMKGMVIRDQNPAGNKLQWRSWNFFENPTGMGSSMHVNINISIDGDTPKGMVYNGKSYLHFRKPSFNDHWSLRLKLSIFNEWRIWGSGSKPQWMANMGSFGMHSNCPIKS